MDIVTVAGGAARYYEPQLKEAFPEAIFLELENPEMANVDGFWISTVQEGEKLEETASRMKDDQRKINVKIDRRANNYVWQIMDGLNWNPRLCAAKMRELATIGAMVQAGKGVLGHTALGASQEPSLDRQGSASRAPERE